jgi:lambda family phage portal protein
MGWLDILAEALSPRWALERERTKWQLEQFRAYDAAKRPRKWESWRTPSSGARTEVGAGAGKTRDAVRDLLRNNGYAQSAMRTLMRASVGTGIVGTPLLGGKTADQQTLDAWNRWTDAADYDGHHDLYGLQALAVRTFYESGDALIRYKRVPFGDRIAPVRLRVLEPDYIDTGKTSIGNSGDWIDRGIQYDANGRKTGLWLYDVHPGDLSRYLRSKFESQFVPIGEVEHVYEMLRPGQDRGISIFAGAVVPLKDLLDYFEAEAMRKRIEACLSVFITKPDDAAGPGLGGQLMTDAETGMTSTRLSAGMIHRLNQGESVESVTPTGSPDIGEFAEQMQFLAAAASGVMFEHLSGNLKNVNYSSYRVGSFDFAGAIEQRQWLTLIPRLCRPMGMQFAKNARLAGILRRDVTFRWTPPPAITSPDPLKDAKADELNARLGMEPPSRRAEQRGYTWAETVKQYQDDIAISDAAGLMFDGDPRKSPKGEINVDANPDA